MPLYDYLCDSCGHRFDLRQSFSEAPLTDCPVCGKHIRRVIHAAGIVFKGSGFYVTDNKKSSGGGNSSAGKSEGGESNESTDMAKKPSVSNASDTASPDTSGGPAPAKVPTPPSTSSSSESKTA